MRKSLVFLLLGIVITFSLGVYFEKEKPFPYMVINNHVVDTYRSFQPKNIEAKESLSGNQTLSAYLKKTGLIDSYSVPIETSQYPLGGLFRTPLVYKGGMCISDQILFLTAGSGETLLININSQKIIKIFDLINVIGINNNDLISIHDLECEFDKKENKYNLFLSLEKTEFQEELQKYTTQVYAFSLDSNLRKISLLGQVWKSDLGNLNTAGRLLLKEKNNLLISFQDRVGISNEKEDFVAQDPKLIDGKIISINLKERKSNIFSLGHRTIQGLHLGTDGTIYSTEHGERGGDELNIIQENRNYGWPVVSDSLGYDTYQSSLKTNLNYQGFVEPVYFWSPSIGISNLIEIRNFDESWKGNIMVSSLKTMSLYRVQIEKTNVKSVELIKVGKRIRDLQEDSEGNIFLWTDSQHLILIKKAKDKLTRAVFDYYDPILRECMECHHLGDTFPTDTAPSLSNLFSREIASDNFEYSSALKQLPGFWNEEKLLGYLQSPQTVAPGTLMYSQVQDNKKLFLIVKKLKEIQESGQ